MAADNGGRFGPSALARELNYLAADVAEGAAPSSADDLTSHMRQRFDLTRSQDDGLAALAADRTGQDRLAALVGEAARGNGASRFVVVVSPRGGLRGDLVHELRLESAPVAFDEARAADASSIGVAHCDADCRNWGWGGAAQ